jgi:hypothetical protein
MTLHGSKALVDGQHLDVARATTSACARPPDSISPNTSPRFKLVSQLRLLPLPAQTSAAPSG